MFPYEYETTVLGGLPVLVKWTTIGEDYAGSFDEPPSYAEIEYEVCTLKGEYAPWAEKRMTDSDHEQLLDELWKEAESMKYDYL